MFDGELRTFLTVCDCAGFTRAAEILNMSQSAVSAHIRRLEERVGSVLLQRTTRSVTLTPKGETLRGYARAIVSLQEEAKSRLGDQTKLKGHVRIGSSEDFASVNLPHVLRLFGIHNPGVTIELVVDITANLVRLLDDGQLDLVLGKQCNELHADRGDVLWVEPLVWAFAEHLHLEHEPAVPLAFFPEPCAFRDAALRMLAASDCRWRVVFVSPSLAGVRAAAMAGFAATPLPKSTLGMGLRAVSSREGLPELPKVQLLMYRGKIKGRQAGAVEKVAALLKDYATSSLLAKPGATQIDAVRALGDPVPLAQHRAERGLRLPASRHKH